MRARRRPKPRLLNSYAGVMAKPSGLIFEWNSKLRNFAARGPSQAGGTFTNTDATNRWYLDPSDNLYKAAAANQPRFVAEGLLLEPAATNLIYPAIPDTVSWLNAGLAATPLATGKADPAGGAAAIAIKEDGNTSTHFVGSITTVVALNDFVSATCFVKAGTRTWVVVLINLLDGALGFLGQARCYVNLSTGATGVVSDDGGGNLTIVGALPPQKFSNGWWRIGVIGKFVAGAGVYARMYVAPASGDGGISYAGVDGDEASQVWRCDLVIDNIYIYGGITSQSIPTTTGTATRASDLAKTSFTHETVLLSATVSKTSYNPHPVLLGLVDGRAFVDFLGAVDLTPYIGKRLTIFQPTTGYRISGYIGEVGTGETYSSNMVLNPDVEADGADWSAWGPTMPTYGRDAFAAEGANGSSHSMQIQANALSNYVVNPKISECTPGAVYLVEAYLKHTVPGEHGGTPSIKIGRSNGTNSLSTILGTGAPADWEKVSLRFNTETNPTLLTTDQSIYYSSGTPLTGATNIMYFDEVSCREVLTPSATGFKIYNAPDLKVQNWEWIHESVTPNYYNATAGGTWTYRVSTGSPITTAFGPSKNFTAIIVGRTFTPTVRNPGNTYPIDLWRQGTTWSSTQNLFYLTTSGLGQRTSCRQHVINYYYDHIYGERRIMVASGNKDTGVLRSGGTNDGITLGYGTDGIYAGCAGGNIAFYFMGAVSSPYIIDSFYIYNRILSDAEILAHWRY